VSTDALSLGAAEVSHYAPRPEPDGPRTVSVHFAGLEHVEVQVRPTTEAQQAAADELARRIAEDMGRLDAIRVEAAAQVEHARATTAAARQRRDDAERSLSLMTSPRQRFFGAVEVRPATRDAWSGEVWLVDPAKGFGGFGLRFGSIAALWQAMPDLRPVAAGQDKSGPWIRVESQPFKAGDA
jgi:hypothetical protein